MTRSEHIVAASARLQKDADARAGTVVDLRLAAFRALAAYAAELAPPVAPVAALTHRSAAAIALRELHATLRAGPDASRAWSQIRTLEGTSAIPREDVDAWGRGWLMAP